MDDMELQLTYAQDRSDADDLHQQLLDPCEDIRHAISFWQRAGIQYDLHVQYLQERLAVPEGTPADPAAGMEMFEPGSVNDCDLSVCNSAHLLNYKSNYIDLSADSLGQLLRQWARFPVQYLCSLWIPSDPKLLAKSQSLHPRQTQSQPPLMMKWVT